MSSLVKPAAMPTVAISQVNGPHRIPVIFRPAAWPGATSGPPAGAGARTRVSGVS